MSLNFIVNPYMEKLKLIVKLINSYEESNLNSDEIYYIIDLLIYHDISKDDNFKGTIILEKIQNIINIECANYTSNEKDLEEERSLFGEKRLKELLINLKKNIIEEMNK